MPGHGELRGAFGRYQILEKIGAGGMGTVYLALDPKLNRRIALKVPHFSSEEDPTVLERFVREAHAAASADHPNICPVYDIGEVDGVHYFTMPYIEGKPLAKMIDPARPWPPRQAVELVRRLALALGEMHERGVVHRDLKPGNILMRKTGEPVLLDFGLARLYSGRGKTLTTAGLVLGTPAYMPREQLEGDSANVGPHSDVYSLGIILYQLLTGRPPFDGEPLSIYAQILHAQPKLPSERRPELDADLDLICLTAIARNPADRFAGMNEFAEALGRYLGGQPAELTLPASVTTTKMEPALPPTREYKATRTSSGAWLAVLAGVVLTLGVVAGGVYLAQQGPDDEGPPGGTGPGPGPAPKVASLRLLTPAPLTLEQGKAGRADVRVERKDLDGPIELRPFEVPEGVTIDAATVPAGKDVVAVEVVASEGVKPGKYTARLRARAGDARSEAALELTVIESSRPKEYRNTLGMTLVGLKPGTFVMGSGADEEDGPAHDVEVTRPFAVSTCEVTAGQFRAFVEATKYVTDAEKQGEGYGFDRDAGRVRKAKGFNWRSVGWEQTDRHPVVNVSYNDAVAFCRWLSAKEGRDYDLPTEAEWEYACRAGTKARFCVGNDVEALERAGNVADASFARQFPGFLTIGGDDGHLFTAPVGKFARNPWGLYDLHGNVWEWCKDGPRPYTKQAVKDPVGPDGPTRVQRGGSWFDDPDNCRCSKRVASPAADRDAYKGFRVVLRGAP